MENKYVGMRYVPKFAEPMEWDSGRMYEPLTIVGHDGDTYVSKRYIAAGVDIGDEGCWARTSNKSVDLIEMQRVLEETASALNTRMENIVVSGTDTDGNTELIDVRTAFDGTLCESAGQAVRAQAELLQAEIQGLSGKITRENRFNPETSISGYIDANGEIIPTEENNYASDFINISGLKKLSINNGLNVAFYDINKSFISRINIPNKYEVEIPEKACYVRISTKYPNACMVGKNLPENSVIPYNYYESEHLNITLSQIKESDYISYKIEAINEILKNAYSPNIINDFYTNISGNMTANNSYITYHKIDTIPNSTIFVNTFFIDSPVIVFYDKNENIINTINNDGNSSNFKRILKTPNNAKSISIPCLKSNQSDFAYFQLVNGTIPDVQKILDDNINKKHDPETNFINLNNLYEGYINGNTSNKGNVVYADGFKCTDYIELKPNTTYYRSGLWHRYYAFYDADKNYITGADNSENATIISNPFTIPEGAVYGRFTITPSNTAAIWISTNNKEPKNYGFYYGITVEKAINSIENPCEYNGTDVSTFRKCLCIGDSLTAGTMNYNADGTTNYTSIPGTSYPDYFNKICGVNTKNLGHGGKTSQEWYEQEKDSDLSGYDVAIIQLGVNDAIRYGTWGETSINAFENIVTKLQNENKNIIRFVANIIPAISYSSSNILNMSSKIYEWATEKNTVDKRIIPLDIQKYGHTKNKDDYNCGHLSAYGYWRLAMDYVSYISYVMANDNSHVFKEIQFIGTDYSYT